MSGDEWDAVDRLRDLEDRAAAVGTTLDALIAWAEREHARLETPRRKQMAANAALYQQILASPGGWVHVGYFRSQGTAQNWRDRGCEVRTTRAGDLWSIEARRR